MAAEEDIIIKSGSWYSYEGERIGQGRENAKQYLREHTDTRLEISGKVRNAYGIGDDLPESAEVVEEAAVDTENVEK